ncbi:SRPBCC family protein [Streptomyces sp. NPDC008141]|uniref:SRPBCC family protein n=1 Tax=Streptomyces sp. NPDC008141 TaxID=3364815 RepID=UPI0036E2FB25
MRLTLRAWGAAPPETVWQRYVQPALWPTWAPQIRSVDTEPELRAGMRGRLLPKAGPAVRFVVTAVDHEERTWSWRVQTGPVRMQLWHAVRPCKGSTTTTELRIEGPLLVVAAYAPLARRALHHLVRP